MPRQKLEIDSFDSSEYESTIVDKNEKLKHFWDLEENEGFITLFNFKVINTINIFMNIRTSFYLSYIYDYIQTLKEILLEFLYFDFQHETRNKLSHNIYLFIVTPCKIQELPENDGFDGMNKPRDIVIYPSRNKLFRDNNLRAGYRMIMLKLREFTKFTSHFVPWVATKTKKLSKDTKHSVKYLLLHELAHTMCNHVVYYDKENHLEDFKACESLLKDISNYPEKFTKIHRSRLIKLDDRLRQF